MKKKPFLFVLAAAGMAMSMASCGEATSSTPTSSGSSSASTSQASGTPVKVGLICLHDSSSTYDKNFIDAMARAKAKLGDKIVGDPIIKTGIGENASCTTTAEDLIDSGCNLIIADSFGHEEYIMSLASSYPNVTFCHATGTHAATAGFSNFHNAFASIYEGRYLAGYAAGLRLKDMIDNGELTDANYDADGNIKLGYVGAYTYAEVMSGYTSWFLGVKEVVSNVVMDVTFTGSWYDIVAEASAANSLATGGAAIISQHADSMGAPSTCESLGIPNVTYNVPTGEDCPNTYVAYSKIDWAPYYEAVINAIYEGKAIEGEVSNNWTGTLATESVIWDCADADDKTAIAAIQAELEAGTRKVFDCSKFTVEGEHLTSYKADVIPDAKYEKDTEAIKTEGGITFFDESTFRSAPYFDVEIDGITLLNRSY